MWHLRVPAVDDFASSAHLFAQHVYGICDGLKNDILAVLLRIKNSFAKNINS